jgi:DNA-directed RNA polymerase specialized sigma24 family protein
MSALTLRRRADAPDYAPSAKRNELFVQWQRWFYKLAHRWHAWLADHDIRTTLDVDDIAHEFIGAALERFPWWDSNRCSFATWARWIARSRMSNLLARARRAKQTASLEGLTCFLGDARQIQPWVLAAVKEEPAAPEPESLPPVLRRCSEMLRDVYITIRDTGDVQPLLTCEIAERFGVNRVTICRAAGELRRLGLARQTGAGRWKLAGRPSGRQKRRPARRLVNSTTQA